MASWTVLDNEARNHTVTTTQNTTATITPAVGDIIFFGGTSSAGANAAVSGGGMTWTQLVLDAANTSSVFGTAFIASSGTPSAGVLTYSDSGDSFADSCYLIIRPVDLGTGTLAGNADSGVGGVASLTVPLTTSSPAGLYAWFIADGNQTWTPDTGWTEGIDEGIIDGVSHSSQYRTSDDTEVIGTPAANERIVGIAIEFPAAAASGSTLGGLVGSNTGLIG